MGDLADDARNAEQAAAELPPPPPQVVAAAGSHLEALRAQYFEAKAEVEEATSRLDALKTALKAELNSRHPNSRHVQLIGHHGPALEIVYSEGAWRIDSRKLKAQDPETYVRFAKQSAPTWTLREVK